MAGDNNYRNGDSELPPGKEREQYINTRDGSPGRKNRAGHRQHPSAKMLTSKEQEAHAVHAATADDLLLNLAINLYQLPRAARRKLLPGNTDILTRQRLIQVIANQDIGLSSWQRALLSDVLCRWHELTDETDLDLRKTFQEFDLAIVNSELLQLRILAHVLMSTLQQLASDNKALITIDRRYIEGLLESTSVCRTCTCKQYYFYLGLQQVCTDFDKLSFDGQNITPASLTAFLQSNRIYTPVETVFPSVQASSSRIESTEHSYPTMLPKTAVRFG